MRILAILLLSALTPALAAAESAPIACSHGQVLPDTLNVPANLSAFILAGGYYSSAGAPDIRLYQRLGTGDVEQGLDVSDGPYRGGVQSWELTPAAALVPGESYVFIEETCPPSPTETLFTVVPEVALPTTLGVTTVSELRSVRYYPGDDLQYYVRVALTLEPEAAAAKVLYEGDWRHDGTGAGGWRALDDFDDKVAIACGELTGIAPGAGAFSHHAWQYGLGPSLFTDPVEVTIDCADAVRVDPDDEHVLTPEEIEEMDRIVDAGPDIDGGTMDGGVALGGGGCTCRATGQGPAPGWLGLLFFVAVLGRRWRR